MGLCPSTRNRWFETAPLTTFTVRHQPIQVGNTSKYLFFIRRHLHHLHHHHLHIPFQHSPFSIAQHSPINLLVYVWNNDVLRVVAALLSTQVLAAHFHPGRIPSSGAYHPGSFQFTSSELSQTACPTFIHIWGRAAAERANLQGRIKIDNR